MKPSEAGIWFRWLVAQRLSKRLLGIGRWVIDVKELRDGGGKASGADGAVMMAILDPAADEEQGDMCVVVPGAAVSRAFGTRHAVGIKHEEHVAAAARMKRPLHLLIELATDIARQLVAGECRGNVRLIEQPIADDPLGELKFAGAAGL